MRNAVRERRVGLLQNYLPVLIFMIIGLGVGLIAPVLGYLLSPKRPYPEKLSSYECGFDPFDDARAPFDVRYYLVAILFIIFDLENCFFVSLVVVFWQLRLFCFVRIG